MKEKKEAVLNIKGILKTYNKGRLDKLTSEKIANVCGISRMQLHNISNKPNKDLQKIKVYKNSDFFNLCSFKEINTTLKVICVIQDITKCKFSDLIVTK